MVLEDAGCFLEIQLGEGLLLGTEGGDLIRFGFGLVLGAQGTSSWVRLGVIIRFGLGFEFELGEYGAKEDCGVVAGSGACWASVRQGQAIDKEPALLKHG